MSGNKLFRRNWLNKSICYLYLSILSIFAAFPLIWVVLSSFKSKGEIAANPTAFFPQKFSLEYYWIVLKQLNFTNNIVNSILVALFATILAMAISSLGAYGIVRFYPRFGKALTRVLITTYMFPPILLAVPYSVLVGKVALTNSSIGLIIVYLSFSVPYAIWLLVGFFQTVPLEIEEAARVDGASKIGVFFQVVLPIVSPGLVAVAVYTFINAWNEFLYALILINSRSKMTVSVALKTLEGQEVLDWGVMMAASTLVVIPSVIFFMLIQKRIAGGMAQGAIK